MPTTAMKFFRASSSPFNGRSRPNVVGLRASSASHSNSLLLVPREIEVTGSGFGRLMLSRQLRSTAATSLLPFSTGAAADSPPKTFQRTIPSASRFSHGAAPPPPPPPPDSDIIRSLRSFIDSEPPVVFGVPVGSPFEIFGLPVGSRFEAFVNYHQDNGESAVYHYRYNGEFVYVEVDKKDVNSGNFRSSATEFTVCVLKLQECTRVMFCISAFEGEIKIHSLAFGDLKVLHLLNCCDNPFDYPPDRRDFSERYHLRLVSRTVCSTFVKYLPGGVEWLLVRELVLLLGVYMEVCFSTDGEEEESTSF